MKQLFPWKPLARQGSPASTMSFKAPQVSGVPGWILLSHDRDGRAQALFTDAKGQRQEPLKVVLDERMCCDTVLRVVKLSKDVFVVADILWMNGTQIHAKTTFAHRQELIANLLDTFHVPDFAALIGVNDLPVGTIVRGHEFYDENQGTLGVFLPTTT
jgi:hypothetical protein